MSKEKFVIIDGNSLANRAFYAIPLLSNSKGVLTNAVYGFHNMIMRILEDEKPEYMAVAFDISRKVFRHEQYEEYKGNRKGMPDELRSQMDLIKDLLKALNISFYGKEGFEADDLIGTMVKLGEAKGLENLVVTGDRDALQLVSDNTKVLLTKKGITNIEVNDPALIKEKYDLTPLQIIDLKGLMGDSSDNIPGVPGVGEKTALKLLHQYGNVEKIYESLDDFKGKKLGEKLSDNKDKAFMSKELATICCNVEMDFDFEEVKVNEYKTPELIAFYKELEFKNLYQNSLANDEDSKNKLKNEGEVLTSLEDFEKILAKKVNNELTFLFDVKPKEKKVSGIGFLVSDSAYYISVEDELKVYLNILKPYLEAKEVTKYTHDVKKAQLCFLREGIHLDGSIWDTLLGAYLLDPSQNDLELSTLISKYLGASVEGEETIFASLYGLKEAAQEIITKLKDDKLMKLYLDVELPLTTVLAKMELQGVKLDKAQLEAMGKDLHGRIELLTDKIYKLAGEEFNINSPKQLGVILFDKLGLPVVKKTKTGYSTDAEVLDTLANEHEVVKDILTYRQLVKLKSTYVDGLLNILDPENDKVYTSFNQTITATGRLSSTEPNLQNIPIRLEEGRNIRKAFIPSKDSSIILTADYSQIELRILAHVAQDEVLIQAFKDGQDIHSRTASEVFGVSMEDVTKEMRRHAKAINFGIVYGLSDYGLAKDLGITRKKAKEYIDNYFDRYHGVKEWIDNIIVEAREQGYVTTLMARRRYLRDILSKNHNLRKFAERTAMNTPIQGSAADIIKVAMLRINQKLEEQNFKTKMLIQVHDELVFEVPPSESSRVITIVRKSMEEAFALDVPLTVDMQVGFNWYELESI